MTDTKKKNALCNTKSKKVRGWAFTLNNYTKEDIKMLMSHKAEYVFQEETGEKGTPHLQGYIRFPNALSFKSIKDKIPRAHIGPARNKIASIRYCSKPETRTGKIYTNIDISQYQHKDTGTLNEDQDFIAWLKKCEKEDQEEKLKQEINEMNLGPYFTTASNFLSKNGIWEAIPGIDYDEKTGRYYD